MRSLTFGLLATVSFISCSVQATQAQQNPTQLNTNVSIPASTSQSCAIEQRLHDQGAITSLELLNCQENAKPAHQRQNQSPEALANHAQERCHRLQSLFNAGAIPEVELLQCLTINDRAIQRDQAEMAYLRAKVLYEQGAVSAAYVQKFYLRYQSFLTSNR